MKYNSRTQTFLRELRLPRAERAAARAERRAEDQMRQTRDNDQTPARRAAAIDAEARRHQDLSSGSWSPMGPAGEPAAPKETACPDLSADTGGSAATSSSSPTAGSLDESNRGRGARGLSFRRTRHGPSSTAITVGYGAFTYAE